jgi:hypothetical protein
LTTLYEPEKTNFFHPSLSFFKFLIMKKIFKKLAKAATVFSLLLCMIFIFSCGKKPNNGKDTVSEQKAGSPVTIAGTVNAVVFGKDGYTADVQTEADGTYSALVSIVNVGGREHYKTCEVGDMVRFKGIVSMIGDTKQLIVTEITSIAPVQTQLLIAPFSFRGIRVGDAIADHKEYLQKTTLKTGEGSFEAYEIKDFENNPAGYLLPDPKNTRLVGDITVQSPKARTAKGIKIGDTFKDLLAVFPEIEVHGSEIEGHTFATAHNLSYRLDVANFSYEIDWAKTPPTTKIMEIIVHRGK